jgi:hypothetical protein
MILETTPQQSDRRCIRDRRVSFWIDRRWFSPARIRNRGKKKLPLTNQDPDFIPDGRTPRRKEDFEETQDGK